MLIKMVLKRNFLSLHIDERAPSKPWETYWKSMEKMLLKAQSVVVIDNWFENIAPLHMAFDCCV
jgi:hypothetical protein